MKRINLLVLAIIIIIFLFPVPSGYSQSLNPESGTLRIEKLSDRTAFVRMEKNAVLRFKVTNIRKEPIENSVLAIVFGWGSHAPDVKNADSVNIIKLNRLIPGESMEIPVHLNTSIRPDEYAFTVSYSTDGKGNFVKIGEFPVRIVVRKLSGEYPVIAWNTGLQYIDDLKRIGVTHTANKIGDLEKVFKAGKPVPPDSEENIKKMRKVMDEALAEGITFGSNTPMDSDKFYEKYYRVDRDGKPFERKSVCCLFPEIKEFQYNLGVSLAQAFGDMPAYGMANVNPERRDFARPCFHEHDYDAFRKASGMKIPKEVPAGKDVNKYTSKSVNYKTIKGFPQDRIIKDNDPIYQYYRWYWKEGDGWPGLNTEFNKGIKTMNRPEFWTWHDPAVRVGSVFGSGGEVDCISQWTYAFPDPINIGVAADETLAMADGADHKQDVMSMIQLAWRRWQTAPLTAEVKIGPALKVNWENVFNEERIMITIPPVSYRIAFWTAISRPIKGIMHWGWPAVAAGGNHRISRLTNPETQFVMERLFRDVIKPLGPVLKTVPGIKSDIAYYYSFAAQVYAGRGTRGWGKSWLADAYQVMMWAGLQPEIVYDETITRDGLDSYKILVMMDCDVVTESIAKKIKDFQDRGGIVIADEKLAPALKANIFLGTYKRTGSALEDKTEFLRLAGQLRDTLSNNIYMPYLYSSNPEVVPYYRRFEETDYIFLVNDHREAGQYIGHHGLVMENGLPSTSTISVQRKNGFAYDLVNQKPVQFRKENNRMTTDINMAPGEGKLIMFTPSEIDRIEITDPGNCMRGDHKIIDIRVLGPQGSPVVAVIPMKIDIRDPEGRSAEMSGYWAAVNGELSFAIDIASNDYEGMWQIKTRELASGKSASSYFRVGKPPESVRKSVPIDQSLFNVVPKDDK